ncbi:hypothetical protein BS50DRAFT_578034 [Corynespora cassiicola Philippines]|uniref:C2H2 type master regulator of conidiophore development brlA n=1 Tax=Corynespora cassiicola Philippines TaxID=1448308 RepID=A0A2T2N9P1_CORCC|nr:hypothetical protein BS50DRAFT_578034 [Corynespora cassiicola Philippines]
MSSRDQPTPPFNSPYQQVVKANTLLHSPAYPSPARSDTEPSKYPADGLGLYNYAPAYPTTQAPNTAVLYPPSPQPTEAWAHLSTGASPLMTDAIVDPWTSGAYDHPVSRSPLPWAPHHSSHRSSLSSTREMSIFSRDGSEHTFPHVKLENGAEYYTEDDASPAMRQAPMTVAPERLTTGIFPYDHPYTSPPLPKFEAQPAELYEDIGLYERSSESPSLKDDSGITPRQRIRKTPTTRENANHICEKCGKMFQRAYNHKTHLETHNPSRKKEHICYYEDCKRPFVRKTDLERHLNSVHYKKRDFYCKKCDSRFARKDTLRRHEEDGCQRRNDIQPDCMLARTRSTMRRPGAPLPYFQSPRPDMYDSRTPPLFRDDNFPGTPCGF